MREKGEKESRTPATLFELSFVTIAIGDLLTSIPTNLPISTAVATSFQLAKTKLIMTVHGASFTKYLTLLALERKMVGPLLINVTRKRASKSICDL